MKETKLNLNNLHHQILIATLTAFVDDFEYTPRELYELMDDSKKQMWSALQEISAEKENKSDKLI